MTRVVITRPKAQAAQFAQSLQKAGLKPVFFPVIHIRPPLDTQALDKALHRLQEYDWLVLTSVNGVLSVWGQLELVGIQTLPSKLKVAAIGPKTASALEERGVIPDFVPDEYVAEAIAPGLGELAGRRVLLAQADLARKTLAENIRLAGGIVDEVIAYRTVPAAPDPRGLAALRAGVGVITFTSSSTVINFLSLTRAAGLDPFALPGNPIIACIGPITAETARQEGLTVSLTAGEFTTEGLLQAILSYLPTSPLEQ
jgi:uroporphyrinogen-III synthase